MSEYTPEPWAYSGYCEIDMCHHIGTIGNNQETGINLGDGKCIAKLTADSCGETPEESTANARRIVACVNACTGLPIEALEESATLPGGFGTMAAEYLDRLKKAEAEIAKLRAEREELRAALDGVIDYAEDWHGYYCEMCGERRKEQQDAMLGAILKARAALAEKGE